MEREEYLAHHVAGSVADNSAEQINLGYAENFSHVGDGEFPLGIQPQDFEEERARYRGFQAVQAVNAGVQRRVRRAAAYQHLIAFRVVEQLFQQRFGRDIPFFDVCLECEIDLAYAGSGLLLYAQVVANKRADVVFRADLYPVPVVFVVFVLLLGRKPHEDKVTYLVALA